MGDEPKDATPKKGKGRRESHAEVRAMQKEVFLGAYRETGNVSISAKRAGVDRCTPYSWHKDDEEFAKEWDIARPVAASVIEDALIKRAVEGVDKPVFRQGSCVGYVKEYSDTAAIFLLKGMKPHVYRERYDINNKITDNRKADELTDDELLTRIEKLKSKEDE